MKNSITAKRLATALSNANMIPQELANASGVSKASISQYLNGSHAPSNISSGKMASVLNVNPIWLMGFDVPMERVIASDTITLYNVHCETEQEAGLILTYRKLNSPNQKKCSTYAQKLLSTQELEDEVGLLAAHVRTDIQPSPEDIQHDLDIMNDDSKWN